MKSFFAKTFGVIKAVFTQPSRRSILLDGELVEPIGEAYPAEVSEAEPVEIGRSYKMIFFSALGLTILSFIVAFYLSSFKELNSQQKDLFDTCSTTWKMGFGAIIGLIGGKAV